MIYCTVINLKTRKPIKQITGLVVLYETRKEARYHNKYFVPERRGYAVAKVNVEEIKS